MDLYYLIENSDGFERPIGMGTEQELALEQKRLQKGSALSPGAEGRPGWETIEYYTVPKPEWDSQHCPLIPVDYS